MQANDEPRRPGHERRILLVLILCTLAVITGCSSLSLWVRSYPGPIQPPEQVALVILAPNVSIATPEGRWVRSLRIEMLPGTHQIQVGYGGGYGLQGVLQRKITVKAGRIYALSAVRSGFDNRKWRADLDELHGPEYRTEWLKERAGGGEIADWPSPSPPEEEIGLFGM
jgi:hypothetical protein